MVKGRKTDKNPPDKPITSRLVSSKLARIPVLIAVAFVLSFSGIVLAGSVISGISVISGAVSGPIPWSYRLIVASARSWSTVR